MHIAIKKSVKTLQFIYVTKQDMAGYYQADHTPEFELNQILSSALSFEASDIHFCQNKDTISTFFRIRGQCIPYIRAIQHPSQLKNIIKFRSGLDLSIRNKSQDGQFYWTHQNQTLFFRVSCIPTLYGEDIVCRLFNETEDRFTFEACQFPKHIQTRFKELLKKKSGLICVTGPTGSGKTSTLYSAIRHLKNTQAVQIISLEDPVEVPINNIRQVPVNAPHFTFSDGLTAILRQDPDVIIIGEIRDKESAKIALDAAYTGHLVLCSLHTNSVENTIRRLQSFDLDPFLIQHSLLAICNQTLTPIQCIQCSGYGCNHCHHTGISHRHLQCEYFEVHPSNPLDLLNIPFESLCHHHMYIKT